MNAFVTDQFYLERFLIGSNKVIWARLMQNVTFDDRGHTLNAGRYKQTDTILPKHIGVNIIFD
jgi:hypothetical protein